MAGCQRSDRRKAPLWTVRRSRWNLQRRTTTSQIEAQNARFTPSDVTAFFGDLGIGNTIEYKNAIDAANARVVQLFALSTEKGCDLNLVGEPLHQKSGS